MMFHPVILAVLLYASLGLSMVLVRGCDRDISALKRQGGEIKLGVARLLAAVEPFG
ncbi:MAG: hypothetical protein HY555_03530 [Euryarchaeota archaeon]|nr:hypothetical protein [Euryarchaeota archaeon]